MKKALGIFEIGVGVICSLASVLNFTDYATKERGYEVDLLRSTSAYVQSYQGESPKEPLAYLQRTMDIAKQNPAFQESLGKLEKEVQEISTQIGESKTPAVYQPVLKSVGEKIDKAVKEKTGSTNSLPWGIGMGALALLNFGLAVPNMKRDD